MKKIVITGAAKENSLGFEIAKIFSESGNFEIFILDIEKPSKLFKNQIYLNCDVSDDYFKIKEKIFEKISDGVDVLINCAGINSLSWFEEIDFSVFQKIQDVNFTGPIKISKILLGQLAQKSGVILNIISKGADQPFRTSLAYNTSKAALAMATKQMARELTPKFGITVFGISPNEIEGTNLTNQVAKEVKEVRGWSDDAVKAAQVGATLNGKLSSSKQIANFIYFLLSEKERHESLSGAILNYGI